MIDFINIDQAYGGLRAGPTVYERDRGWYWVDETWDERGPYSSEESARRRQSLYIAIELENGIVNGMTHVLASRWKAKKEAESEGTVHPCNTACAWDCDCVGACSCHWNSIDKVPT